MARTSVTTECDPSNGSDPNVIAHRGFAGVYPENTVAAVEQATESAGGESNPPEMVEIDVMPTADGEVVVFHDTVFGRLTDAPASYSDALVWETPYERLHELSILGTDEPIPRLAAVLDAIPSEVGVNVEFKNPGSTEVRPRENLPPDARDVQKRLWLDFAERTLSVLAEYDHDVLVSSFAEGALAAVRELAPSMPLATVFATSVTDGMEVARRYDCEAVHPPWNMISGTELFNAEYGSLGPYEDAPLVEVAHDEGRDVNVWTVESWYQADQLRRTDVDGLIADYPGVLQFTDAAAPAAASDD